MKDAVQCVLECLGAAAMFFGFNLALGATLIGAVRASGARFVPFYVLDDVILLILSAVQGLLFLFWWKSR